MASVPSAGCLLAKNQFYRVRLNSESSVCSNNSDTEPEKPHAGLPEMVEKCWWLKNFFHCEQAPMPSLRINISNESWLPFSLHVDWQFHGKKWISIQFQHLMLPLVKYIKELLPPTLSVQRNSSLHSDKLINYIFSHLNMPTRSFYLNHSV